MRLTSLFRQLSLVLHHFIILIIINILNSSSSSSIFSQHSTNSQCLYARSQVFRLTKVLSSETPLEVRRPQCCLTTWTWPDLHTRTQSTEADPSSQPQAAPPLPPSSPAMGHQYSGLPQLGQRGQVRSSPCQRLVDHCPPPPSHNTPLVLLAQLLRLPSPPELCLVPPLLQPCTLCLSPSPSQRSPSPLANIHLVNTSACPRSLTALLPSLR